MACHNQEIAFVCTVISCQKVFTYLVFFPTSIVCTFDTDDCHNLVTFVNCHRLVYLIYSNLFSPILFLCSNACKFPNFSLSLRCTVSVVLIKKWYCESVLGFTKINNIILIQYQINLLFFFCNAKIEQYPFFSLLQESPKASRAQNESSCRGHIMLGKGNFSCPSTAGTDVRSSYAAPASSSPQSKRARQERCTSCRSSEEKYV